jgi:hypothetical protein
MRGARPPGRCRLLSLSSTLTPPSSLPSFLPLFVQVHCDLVIGPGVIRATTESASLIPPWSNPCALSSSDLSLQDLHAGAAPTAAARRCLQPAPLGLTLEQDLHAGAPPTMAARRRLHPAPLVTLSHRPSIFNPVSSQESRTCATRAVVLRAPADVYCALH